MIYTLLDITFDTTCWVIVKTSTLLVKGVKYLVSDSPTTNKPAIAYSGDKQRDVIYAAGILHHESILDDKTYQDIIDSALLFSIKD